MSQNDLINVFNFVFKKNDFYIVNEEVHEYQEFMLMYLLMNNVLPPVS